MLGKKWKELFKRCDIMSEEIQVLREELEMLKEKCQTEIPKEEDNPYFNPVTRLYDFQYGKAQQTGGSDK